MWLQSHQMHFSLMIFMLDPQVQGWRCEQVLSFLLKTFFIFSPLFFFFLGLIHGVFYGVFFLFGVFLLYCYFLLSFNSMPWHHFSGIVNVYNTNCNYVLTGQRVKSVVISQPEISVFLCGI